MSVKTKGKAKRGKPKVEGVKVLTDNPKGPRLAVTESLAGVYWVLGYATALDERRGRNAGALRIAEAGITIEAFEEMKTPGDVALFADALDHARYLMGVIYGGRWS